eukprot:10907582-Heterocapsa_arctica.AAC.1
MSGCSMPKAVATTEDSRVPPSDTLALESACSHHAEVPRPAIAKSTAWTTQPMSATADDPLQRQDKTPSLSSIHMTLTPWRTCDSWKMQNREAKASPCA